MWLVDVSIRRPVFATMMISSLVVMGFVAFRGLGVDLFPKIEFPYVSVQTTQPGAAPSSIETEVTDKIEEAVNSISGIRQLRSVSADGLSQVNIEFELNEDPDVKAQEVRDKISGIVADLPDDADAPIVERLDPDAAPVVSVMIAGEQPVAELTRFADEVVKERLQRISGVGSVTLVGGRDREMRIWLDPSKLKAVGLSAPDVLRSVRNENAQLPGGRLETEARQREFGVRTLAEARTAEEFKQMMLAHREGGRSTRLDDIARVEDSVTDERSYAQLNGVVGVALEVRRQSGRNTIEVAKAVMAEVAELQQNAPQGMRLVVARDISRFIESSIDDVLFDLVLAVILVIGITFFFLLSWRATVIVGLAIPTSIMATFFIFGVADFTVNIMTMLALTVAVGLLVDDAIVVVEAVERDIEAGLSPPEPRNRRGGAGRKPTPRLPIDSGSAGACRVAPRSARSEREGTPPASPASQRRSIYINTYLQASFYNQRSTIIIHPGAEAGHRAFRPRSAWRCRAESSPAPRRSRRARPATPTRPPGRRPRRTARRRKGSG